MKGGVRGEWRSSRRSVGGVDAAQEISAVRSGPNRIQKCHCRTCGMTHFFLCFFSFHYTSYLPASSTMSTCESAEDILLKANTEFLDKNFKSALEQYNLSIELDDKVSDAFVKRALCLEKLKRFAGITIIYFTIFYII